MTSVLAKIHIGKKALGLDDDTYHAMLVRLTGLTSAKELTEQQCGRVIDEMKQKGAFNRPLNGTRKPLAGAYAKKLQALWIAGWNLGIIRNKDDAAMLAFVARQTGLSHTRFLHYADDATRAIEALKGWIERESGVSFGRAADGSYEFSARIAYRQWQTLLEAGVKAIKKKNINYPLHADFAAFIRALNGNRQGPYWIEHMNILGQEVRKCVKKRGEHG